MPCEKALELMLAMHKENRGIETQEEATAYEHFGWPFSCERNKACAMLTRPESDYRGEEEYRYVEIELIKMKKIITGA